MQKWSQWCCQDRRAWGTRRDWINGLFWSKGDWGNTIFFDVLYPKFYNLSGADIKPQTFPVQGWYHFEFNHAIPKLITALHCLNWEWQFPFLVLCTSRLLKRKFTQSCYKRNLQTKTNTYSNCLMMHSYESVMQIIAAPSDRSEIIQNPLIGAGWLYK